MASLTTTTEKTQDERRAEIMAKLAKAKAERDAATVAATTTETDTKDHVLNSKDYGTHS
jgi:hypothetical protein